jgi:hypothetical protein
MIQSGSKRREKKKEVQSCHDQLQWTYTQPVEQRSFEECVDVTPDKLTICTNLILILYHFNTEV